MRDIEFAFALFLLVLALAVSTPARAQDTGCGALPGQADLQRVLRSVVDAGNPDANGGLAHNEWAVMVNRQGQVCAVARSGETPGDQWPGSRGIAAAKAFTANGFSLPNFALSTANLYWPAQPGGTLYGAGAGNPADPAVIYKGPVSAWGTANDPMVGATPGGTIVFGGGLALYNANGMLVGAIGLSGDQPCTDHVIAWKIRGQLNLNHVPMGVNPDGSDNIIFDIVTDPATDKEKSPSGYGHPKCDPLGTDMARNLTLSPQKP